MKVLTNQNIKPLSDEDKLKLRKRIINAKNNREELKLRRILVKRNVKLAFNIANKFKNLSIDYEDIVSIAIIGLIKAANKFDPKKNNKFATFASVCMSNEICMRIRKEKKEGSSRYNSISLQNTISKSKDDNEKLTLEDILAIDEEELFSQVEDNINREKLMSMINKLDKRDREIIILRFGLADFKPKTQIEIAHLLNISQSYVSRLEKEIIGKLRLMNKGGA